MATVNKLRDRRKPKKAKQLNVSNRPLLALVPSISIMDRYLSYEMIAPFMFGVGAFTSIALAIGSLFELVRLMTDAGLDLWSAIQIFGLRLPGFMVYSFPMAVLLSTLISYSRLSSDGEITALRSCGISVYRLVGPAIALSLIVSGLTFAFNEVIVPSANWQAKTTLRTALNEDNPLFKTNDIFYNQYGDIVYPDGRVESGLVRSFYARRFDGTQMIDLTVMDFSQGSLQQISVAKSAFWLTSQNVWQFNDGTTYIISPDGSYQSILSFEEQRLKLPRAPLDLAQEQRSSDEMNIRELSRHVELIRQSGNIKEERKLEVRLQQKYALPFICLVFALVGAPLGMRPQRTSTALGFGLSVLIIFGYYVLLFICGALGQVGIIAPLVAAWLPNIICLSIGGLLLSRVN
ncbi:permease YjgP/YjgQ family protein [Thalassoporum mexicanum PCC 7367]|uniref:LptF/LptG family permease n=1 Tax=Thalassoporum mexicanum TaxID=3457544 RepID=UPI00029FCC84|nr:LptF/LptG family permease [Pseudanabaena sp. PCC 7367]AFY70821.1 permease YjgP/YjgQ family protein [Pseudanabaena sp. PCC 7367]